MSDFNHWEPAGFGKEDIADVASVTLAPRRLAFLLAHEAL